VKENVRDYGVKKIHRFSMSVVFRMARTMWSRSSLLLQLLHYWLRQGYVLCTELDKGEVDQGANVSTHLVQALELQIDIFSSQVRSRSFFIHTIVIPYGCHATRL